MIKKVKSFRLLTEYYSFLLEQKTEFIYTVELPIVSVSLRSIIHSYTLITFNVFSCLYSFRLLTEYYSFLLEKNLKGCKDSFKFRVSVSLRSIIHSYKSKYVMIHLIKNESFRLLTEYYSFLLKTCNYWIIYLLKFPSPYGVLFILINKKIVEVLKCIKN